MIYLYPCGVIKALDILSNDKTVKIKEETKKLLLNEINEVEFSENKLIDKKHNIIKKSKKYDMLIQICINFGETEKKILL